MSQSPSYAKVPLADPAVAPSAPPVDSSSPTMTAAPPHVYDPPPPYEAAGFQPVVSGPPPQPPIAYGQPPTSVPVVYAPQPPPQIVVAQAAPTSVVVTQRLAPGVCSVCRKGKIRNTRTFWTYFWCLVGCFFLGLPGILAWFCCCREPKCSHCGYTP